MEQSRGMLSLCATPIGNMEDITLRVLRALREADAVWAEDTRRTLGLLNHHGIKKTLVSCHEHNERARAAQAIETLREGGRIAYCSDAGMPGISDPGAVLLRACMDAGLPCEILPGASAAPMAAVLSGLDCSAFAFYGFLPRDKKPRAAMLAQLCDCPVQMLLYESPVRLPGTLRELAQALGEDRPAAVMRELTKLHEEVCRGTLSQLCERFCDPPKGECVIAVAGKPEEEQQQAAPEQIDAALLRLLEAGCSVKDAATQAALSLHMPKKDAYRRALELRGE